GANRYRGDCAIWWLVHREMGGRKAVLSDGFEIVEKEFERIVGAGPELRRIAEGFEFAEGPVWFENGLVFSDIPGDTIYRWTEGEGLSVWRRPSHHANGNTVDLEGRLITCEHGSRRVTRTERDGSVTVLAATYGGKRLNSPNDVVVKSDGSIWFTDPPYGIEEQEKEQAGNYVFRLDPGAEEPVAVADDFSMPNGLYFSPDEETLYIADSAHEIAQVRKFAVQKYGTLGPGGTWVAVAPGIPDGLRTDTAGRVYVCAGNGVQVFRPDGRLLGRIGTPETAANCTFGGVGKRTLFITAVSAVWAVELGVEGR
ncbi:MAG TPA: SMP-30/gluconolactonase/LRE family protein, partial [Anaerolineae bacterium]|nr:SMP-30/gluconolactonase/LRE family protein [Anaerolineae bacterium]